MAVAMADQKADWLVVERVVSMAAVMGEILAELKVVLKVVLMVVLMVVGRAVMSVYLLVVSRVDKLVAMMDKTSEDVKADMLGYLTGV